jgi:hypothetical protein
VHFEDIFEPIEVITYFRDGQLQPLRFRWNGRVYRIQQINGQWQEFQGRGRQVHYSVSSGNSDNFELLFDSGDFSWQLARIGLEG